MELDWLETFLAVVDRGGFTAASAQVHRSQSRVSAHLAALERELGVRLIDRARRPVAVTAAGHIFVGHARRILNEVGAARSAILLLQAMDSECLDVLTTPSIGAVLFPGVLATMLELHPRARLSLSERASPDKAPTEHFALSVVPTMTPPHTDGLKEHLLWREPIKVVVPADHELARQGDAVTLHRLITYPLVVNGGSVHGRHEVLKMLADRGFPVQARASVDAPQTLIEMTRRGVGIGVENAVALGQTDTTGLVILDVDDSALVTEVAAYWYDSLLSAEVGRALHRTVLTAPLPAGAMPVGNWRTDLMMLPGPAAASHPGTGDSGPLSR